MEFPTLQLIQWHFLEHGDLVTPLYALIIALTFYSSNLFCFQSFLVFNENSLSVTLTFTSSGEFASFVDMNRFVKILTNFGIQFQKRSERLASQEIFVNSSFETRYDNANDDRESRLKSHIQIGPTIIESPSSSSTYKLIWFNFIFLCLFHFLIEANWTSDGSRWRTKVEWDVCGYAGKSKVTWKLLLEILLFYLMNNNGEALNWLIYTRMI